MREQKAIAADIAQNLRNLADALQEFVESFQDKDNPAEETAKEQDSSPTLEQVRTALAGVSLAGHGAEIKAIIAKYGATKLSDVAPENLAAVLKEAESLGK